MWIYLKNLTESACLAESERSMLDCPNGLKQSPIAKTTDFAKACCFQEWQVATSITPPSGMMSKPFQLNHLRKKLMSLQRVSRVKILAVQGLEKAWKESEADFFSRSFAWPKKSSPLSYFLKMSRPLQLEGDFKLLERLPKWGTIVDGALYPLQAWVPSIDASAGSYWLTPSTMEHLPVREGKALERALHRGNSSTRRKVSGRLNEQVAYPHMWPTPTTQEIEHSNLVLKGNRRLCKNGKTHSLGLADVVKMMWPTPNASDSFNANLKDDHDFKKQYLRGVVLYTSVGRLDPSMIGKKLSARWVNALMGLPQEWTTIHKDLKPWAIPASRSKRKPPLNT